MPTREQAEALAIRFDDTPYVLGPYVLTTTGMEVHGKRPPSLKEHLAAGTFACRAFKRSGWWLADWLRYGESRRDWAEILDQAHSLTGLSLQTLRNVRALGAIPPGVRDPEVEFTLYRPLVGMEPERITHYVERSKTEGWGNRELRQVVRADKRAAVIEGQAHLEGQHRVLLVDCPWKYEQAQPSLSSSAAHYPPMTIEQLCDLPVKPHTTKNAVMGFWVPAPLLYDAPGPRDVIEAWGFTYKALIVWHKVRPAGGFYTQGDTELFLICTRGSGTPDVPDGLPSGVYVERKDPEHSRKPDYFRRILMKHWTTGPYLELFGRRRAEGWSVYGNDPKLWQ
jgi:N6-adenosine-specific RNA methylase IME4